MPAVLVVDDDSVFRKQMFDLLSAAGYAVLSASDALQALKLIEHFSDTLAVVIVDLVLPCRSGYEVIGCVADRLPSIKLLGTTGLLKHPLWSAKRQSGHS